MPCGPFSAGHAQYLSYVSLYEQVRLAWGIVKGDGIPPSRLIHEKRELPWQLPFLPRLQTNHNTCHCEPVRTLAWQSVLF